MLIAEVRGDLGYPLAAPPAEEGRIYLKFGMYRDVAPGTIRVHLDHFRQGLRREDVL